VSKKEGTTMPDRESILTLTAAILLATEARSPEGATLHAPKLILRAVETAAQINSTVQDVLRNEKALIDRHQRQSPVG
jgi:hypothetical protein